MEPIKILVLFGLINVLPLLSGFVGFVAAFERDTSLKEGFVKHFLYTHWAQVALGFMVLITIGLYYIIPRFAFSIYDLFVWIFS